MRRNEISGVDYKSIFRQSKIVFLRYTAQCFSLSPPIHTPANQINFSLFVVAIVAREEKQYRRYHPTSAVDGVGIGSVPKAITAEGQCLRASLVFNKKVFAGLQATNSTIFGQLPAYVSPDTTNFWFVSQPRRGKECVRFCVWRRSDIGFLMFMELTLKKLLV